MSGNGHPTPPAFHEVTRELSDEDARSIRAAGERCSTDLREADERFALAMSEAAQLQQSAFEERARAHARARARLEEARSDAIDGQGFGGKILGVSFRDGRRGARLVVKVEGPAPKPEDLKVVDLALKRVDAKEGA